MSEVQLFLLRHGPAGDAGPEYPDDSKRPLTPDGMKEVKQAAKGMKSLGLKFDAVFSSNFVRAVQTAEIASDVLGQKDPVRLTSNLHPGADPQVLLKYLAGHSGLHKILLTGHEPFMSSFISFLVFGRQGASVQMKKTGLAKLSLESGFRSQYAVLKWLLTPKQLIHLS